MKPEITWRVEAMKPQIPKTGPIPFLVAKYDTVPTGWKQDLCPSCGEVIEPQILTAYDDNKDKTSVTLHSYVCTLCCEAKRIAIESVRETAPALKLVPTPVTESENDTEILSEEDGVDWFNKW
jgi:hypothetical protein